MIVGIGSFAFGWAVAEARPRFDEQDLLAFAESHGLAALQLADNLPVHTMEAERLTGFVHACDRAGVQIELGARGLTDAHLETSLDLCRRCRARLLRFVADAPPYEPSVESIIALLGNALPALADAGVTLALENHDRFPAAVLRRIIDALADEHVGICLDTANSLGAGEGLDAVTGTLAPVTVNLHVKDVAIRRLPHQMGFVVEGRPLGAGQLPIARTIARVFDAGRCRSVILESWTPPSAAIEHTIRDERAGVESSIEVLKALVARELGCRTG